MKHRFAVFFFVTALVIFARDSIAFPIPPRSLRQLYHDAELIVVANVL